MTLFNFVDKHFDDLRMDIYNWHGVKCYDHAEIEEWVMNEESLYNWAISEGVEV